MNGSLGKTPNGTVVNVPTLNQDMKKKCLKFEVYPWTVCENIKKYDKLDISWNPYNTFPDLRQAWHLLGNKSGQTQHETQKRKKERSRKTEICGADEAKRTGNVVNFFFFFFK